MSLEDCLGAAQECDAPMVSICGGEPLIYPQIEALVKGLLEQGRIVYVCTNGMFMRKKMREWLATQIGSRRAFVDEKINALIAAGLITEKDGAEIRKGPKDAAKPAIASLKLDVLERASRWLGTDARPHRRARRRLQGVHLGDQDGEDPRLSGRDQYHGLQRDRYERDRADVRLSFAISESMATPFRPATNTTRPRRT